MEVPLLGGDRVPLSLSEEIVQPSMVKRLQGKGLPYPKDPSRRGDLLVAFDIAFPDRLPPETRELLASVLPGK